MEGGWKINGQKVWTSEAQQARRGLATVRTDPDAPKHMGITTVIIDMKAPEVEVRPLRQITDESHFNEVFITDAIVPGEYLVGEAGNGWRAPDRLGLRAVDHGRRRSRLPARLARR